MSLVSPGCRRSRSPFSRLHNLALLFAVFLICSNLATAIPLIPKDLPKNATYLAYDEAEGYLLAFDDDGAMRGRYLTSVLAYSGSLQRRDASSCVPLSSDDVTKLPKWADIYKYAEKKFGTGKKTVVTNPNDFPSQGAVACADTHAIPISTDGKPTCAQNTISVKGNITGTSGTERLSMTQGYTSTATFTVDKATSFSVGATFSISVSFANVADVSASATTQTTFTNSQSSTFTASIQNMVTQEILLTHPANSQCFIEFTSKTCHVGGKAQIQIAASGWVWFNYESLTADADDPQKKKHYKWAVLIEGVVKDPAGRAFYSSVTGDIKTEMKSNVQGKCTPLGGAPSNKGKKK